MKFMMKYLMLNCKEATFLVSKKEEGKLAFFEKMKLQVHLHFCKFCKMFEQQTNFIGHNAGQSHLHDHSTLSDATKEKIFRFLNENETLN
ncbi:hypothetical protein GALL_166400 [mine drainage metagenome]|uniref:Uncharacterized protein n=1 Tax=mine drainage metagenome TaxID=410659 RepID=A0A1J5SBD5_9ZZZZ